MTDMRVVGGIAGLIALCALGASVAPQTWGGTLLYTLVGVLLLVWVPQRFKGRIPYRGEPWYRMLVVGVLLAFALLVNS